MNLSRKPEVKFNLREPKSKKETPVYMVLRWPYKNRLVYPTGEKVLPSEWASTRQPLSLGMERLKVLSLELHQRFLAIHDRQPSVEEFRGMIRKEEVPYLNLYGLFEQVISEKTKYGTVKSYSETLRLLRDKWPNLSFDEVTAGFMEKLARYCEHERGYMRNNIHRHLSRLREVMKRAEIENLTRNKDYLRHKYSRESVKTISLTESELEILRNFDISHLNENPYIANAINPNI